MGTLLEARGAGYRLLYADRIMIDEREYIGIVAEVPDFSRTVPRMSTIRGFFFTENNGKLQPVPADVVHSVPDYLVALLCEAEASHIEFCERDEEQIQYLFGMKLVFGGRVVEPA